MIKLKKVGIGLAVIFAIIIVLGIIGFTFTPTDRVTETQPTTSKADHIGSFSVYKDGDVYKVSFNLKDKDDKWVTEDGHVSFKILDKWNEIVYEKEFDIKSSDFKEFWEYKWTISFSEVRKSVYGTGKAILTFRTIANRNLNATDDYVDIPKYSDEEIKAIYENQYLQSAKIVGETITKGNFEVTLVRIGYFTHLAYDEKETYFRADIKVKNIGNEIESFYTSDAAMITGSSQYSYSYRSEFEGSDIYPGVIKEGYILYKDVPKGLSGQVKIVVGSVFGYEISALRWMNILYSFDIEL